MNNSNNALQFNDLAQYYENMMSWPMRKNIETPSVISTLGELSGLHVLDFGCGSGFYARLLKSMGAGHVTGYDACEGMLSFARNHEDQYKYNVEYISELTGHESKYDVVLAVYVLPYAKTTEQLFSMIGEMVSLLRPGGKLVTVPLNPFYDLNENYYYKYGFTLRLEGEVEDGSPVILSFPDHNPVLSVTAWYWSQKALNDALLAANLEHIRWSFPRTEDDDEFLYDYIKCPHALLVEGIRK